jgi:hypothetical protein
MRPTGEDITIMAMDCKPDFLYIQDSLDFTIKILEEEKFVNDVVNVGHDDNIPCWNWRI